jgi:hypothetical protein
MRINTVDLILSAGDDDCIVEAVDPANNATLTLDGIAVSAGVATLDFARRVIITSAADDSSITFTVSGTDRYGNSISEAITGTNASIAVSTKDFKTVTSIVVTGNAGSIKVGTNTKGSSAWVPIDRNVTPINIGIGCEITSGASLNYTVEHTYDDIQDATVLTGTVHVFAHSSIASKTADFEGSYSAPINAFRITLNTWTSGTVRMNSIQAG